MSAVELKKQQFQQTKSWGKFAAQLDRGTKILSQQGNIASPEAWAESNQNYLRQHKFKSAAIEYDQEKQEFRFSWSGETLTSKELATVAGKKENYYTRYGIALQLGKNEARQQPAKPKLSQKIAQVGEDLTKASQGRWGNEALDGYDLISAGTSLTGSLLETTYLASELIQKAREKFSRLSAPGKQKSEVQESIWDNLEKAAQKIDSLQQRLNTLSLAQRDQPLPLPQQIISVSENVENEAEVLADLIENLSSRQRHFEELIDSNSLSRPLQVERSARELMRRCEEALTTLENRLDKLETKIAKLEKELHPLQGTETVISPKRFAQIWQDVFQNRAQGRNEKFSREQNHQLETSSGKTVKLSNKGRSLQISDEQGVIYQAQKQGKRWSVAVNNLTRGDIDRVMALPQLEKEAQKQRQTIGLLEALQETPIWERGGKVNWRDLQIAISPPAPDNNRLIQGYYRDREVLKAEYGNGELKTELNQISADSYAEMKDAVVAKQEEKTEQRQTEQQHQILHQ